MENGIYEAFCIEGGRKCFYQWDLNQKIIVNDRNIDEVHFCNGTSDKSLVSVVKDGKASVPNVLLQVACKVKVYGYSVNHTVVEKVYEVKARTKPEDYVYEETEVYRWAELDKRIQQLEEIGIPEDGKSAYEIAKDNGFDGTEEEWLESLKGKDGADGKDGVNGKDGAAGKDGKDGDTHVFLVREIIDGISDKSKEEAEAAAKAGKAVFLVTKYGEVYSYYAKEKKPDTSVYELLFVMPITKAATGKRRSYIFLGADNALTRKSETPFKAIAENALTIKTANAEIEYDGSEKKEIDLTNLGSGGTVSSPTDEEVLTALAENDLIMAVMDTDGGILADENGTIIEW